MQYSPANYNLVAIGDDGVWMKLGCEIAKIDKCCMIRIPNSLNPYSVCDKYQSRAIFLLPDAIKIYQGSCRTWVQRFRFGPNVNTPIIAIVDDPARGNNDEEMKQLMQLNVINWILTSQELQAVRIVRVLYRCEMVIGRCLESSAAMIVTHGTRRVAFLRNTRTSDTESSDLMLEQSGEQSGELIRGAGKRRHLSETGHITKRSRLGDKTIEHHSSLTTSETSSHQSTLEQKSTSEPDYFKSTSKLGSSSKSTMGQSSQLSVSEPVPLLSTSSDASHDQATSLPTVGRQCTAHVQRVPISNKILKNRHHSFTNTVTAQAQSEIGKISHKNTPLSRTSKKVSLQRRTKELNNKLDKAMMYLSRVGKLLDVETNQQM